MTTYLARTLNVLIILMWLPVAAGAAVLSQTDRGNELMAIPLALVIATTFVSTLAGATTMCLRLVSELKEIAASDRPERALVKPWLYCAAHMLGSWCAGSLFFLMGMQTDAGVWTLLAMVLVASFSGSKALEMAADRYLPASLTRVVP